MTHHQTIILREGDRIELKWLGNDDCYLQVGSPDSGSMQILLTRPMLDRLRLAVTPRGDLRMVKGGA